MGGEEGRSGGGGNSTWVMYVLIFVPVAIIAGAFVLVYTLNKPEKKTPAPNSATQQCASNTECLNGGACNPSTGQCVCPPRWTGNKCQTLVLAPALSAKNCGATPKICTEDSDCAGCSRTEPYSCQQVSASQNPAGLEGNFCLPAKPVDNCALDVCKDIADAAQRAECYSMRVPGTYFWHGWTGSNTQQWACACEYPEYYPAEIGGPDAGACKRSAEVCKHGKWIYPCKTRPEAPGVCLPITSEEEAELLGSLPLMGGKCECQNVPCSQNEDCASNVCAGGVCQYQRTALDPISGLPTCVHDTCSPGGRWVGQETPPYAYGRCECSTGTVDTGHSCVAPPPPANIGPPCANNCSSNGVCLPNGKCACHAGYGGESCSDFSCADIVGITGTSGSGCGLRGECIGPNKCTCPANTVYAGMKMDGMTPNCLPQVACYPEPSVDRVSGAIVNADKYPAALNTGCGYGTVAMLTATCQAAGFTGYRAGKCYKTVDCSAVPCTDPLLCGPAVLPDYVQPKTVYKVPLTDTTCGNPSLEDVKALCSANPMLPPITTTTSMSGTTSGSTSTNGSVSAYVLTEGYRCVNVTPRPLIADPAVLVASSGASVVGTLCAPNISAADKETDGNGIVGFWRLWLAGDTGGPSGGIPDQPVDPASQAYAGGLLRLAATLPPTGSACSTGSGGGYYYVFEATFVGTPAALLPPGTRVLFQAYGVPLTKWTCPKSEVDILKCAPLYMMQTATVLTLQLDPQAQYYTIALTPIFQPCVAYTLAQNAYPNMTSWSSSMLSALRQTSGGAAAIVSGATVDHLAVQPPQQCDESLLTAQTDLVVQIACMDSYCLSFGGGAGVKLMLLVWNNVGSTAQVVKSSGTSSLCAGLDTVYYAAVKYTLTRQYYTGAPVTLIAPSSPIYLTSDAKYAYFVDVVPVAALPYTYSLGAYVARSGTDTLTTYDASPCKSRMQRVVIMVQPYTESFCQSLPPPDPVRTSPSTMWLNHTSGMCEWMDSQANQAAGDYDCLMRAVAQNGGTFNSAALSLVNDNGQCAVVQQSYPALDPNFAWPSSTCDPGATYDQGVCFTGVSQTRAATCAQSLQLSGNSGRITDAPQFSERVSNLYKFYDLHRPVDSNAQPQIQAALTDPASLYRQYYHCGLDTTDAQYDAQWGTVGPCKDPNDKACVDALKTATRTLSNGLVRQVCGVTNKCYEWEDVTPAGATTKAYQQKRQCFPSGDYETAGSPCCSSRGTYDIDMDLVKGTCACAPGTTYSGERCDVNVCNDKQCGANGYCGWDATASPPRVKCICDAGFYNRSYKPPRATYPAPPNDWACTRNECATFSRDFSEYSNTNTANIKGDTQPCGSNMMAAIYVPNGKYPYGSVAPSVLPYDPNIKYYTDLNGVKQMLPASSIFFHNPDPVSAAGVCNNDTGLCTCGDGFGVTEDNTCVMQFCEYGLDNLSQYGMPIVSNTTNDDRLKLTVRNKCTEAATNRQWGDVAFANRGAGWVCDATAKKCTYREAGTLDAIKADTEAGCSCTVIDAGTKTVALSSLATTTMVVPFGTPFQVSLPLIHVRATSAGTVKVVTTGANSAVAWAEARYVVRGFGNVTPGTLDPDSSNPVVLWGQVVGSADINAAGSIAELSDVNGNAFVVQGKTYQMCIVLTAFNCNTVQLTWPAVAITQTDNTGYYTTRVDGALTSLTASLNTPPMLFNNAIIKAPLQLGQLTSPSGAYQLNKYAAQYVSLDALQIVNVATGAASRITFSQTHSLAPTNISRPISMLRLEKNGNLSLLDSSFTEVWRSSNLLWYGLVPPYTVEVSDDGGVLRVVDRNKKVGWSFDPANYIIPSWTDWISTGTGTKNYAQYRVVPLFTFKAWKSTVRIIASAEVDILNNGSGTDRATFALQLKRGNQSFVQYQALPQNFAGSGNDLPTIYSTGNTAEVTRDNNQTNSMDYTFTGAVADGVTVYTIAVRINMNTDDDINVKAGQIQLIFS